MPTFEPKNHEEIAWANGELRIAGATHVGRVRRVNQDAYGHFHDPERGEVLLVVADGLGGHRGGEVASRIAIESLAEQMNQSENDSGIRLEAAIRNANDNILTAARKDRTLDGMGTTLVCLLLSQDNPSFVAHVGDSRLYRLRGASLSGVTNDHSLVATLLREGVLSPQEAREDPRRNQILRALGVREDVEIEIAPLHPLPGDRYLLCSDGLHGMIQDDEIARLIQSESDPIKTVDCLIEAANQAGGTDNVTCLLASLPESTLFPTLRAGATRVFTSTRSLFRKSSDK